MQLRRLRPVAALTLALVAAPFLAATAVAATATAAGSAPKQQRTINVAHAQWIVATKADVQHAVAVVNFAAASVAPPKPAEPGNAVRAATPPPPSDLDDKSTWIWPADGPITSPFGHRWGRRHDGVDIDAGRGTPVIAPQRGTVIAAGWGQRGYGLVVQIQHDNGIVTLVAHLSKVTASVGQVVAQGDQVGLVGATGDATGAHCHYEVHVGGVPVNPVPWLTGEHSMTGHPG
jgi:murein DD-endopeptidase MepM/ murein hydrolase activator NlpD